MQQSQITQEELRDKILSRISVDSTFFKEKCLFITDKKTNKKVRFRLNTVQKYYNKHRSQFDIILKSRKGGISTDCIAEDIWACAFKKNQHAVLLTQNDDATRKMFNDRVVQILKSSIIPLTYKIKFSDHTIEFPETNSVYYAGTAGTKTFGRGSDITRFHLSEFAHWSDMTVLAGLEEALMDGAIGRIETTANGINQFHALWKKSQTGDSRYKPIFIPWFLDDSYNLNGVPVKDLTDEESKLKEAFNLPDSRIAWRRSKIKEMSNPQFFPQEYPATAEEAFLSSGQMVFDWVSLAKHRLNCEEPRLVGFLRDAGERIEFVPDKMEHLRIWSMPNRRHTYVIGADIAEGYKDGAFSAAFVLDVNNNEQVAEWHGKCLPNEFGEILFTLGLFYNKAMIAPESWPGPGEVTTQELINMRYGNIYKREKKKNLARNDNQLYGWETSMRSKQRLIHTLVGDGIKDFGLIIHSKELLDEMYSFIYNVNNKMEPQEGCYSDRLIACAIAWYVSRGISESVIDQSRNLWNTPSSRTSVPVWTGRRYGRRD